MTDIRNVPAQPVVASEKLPEAQPQTAVSITPKGQIAAVAAAVRDAGRWFRVRFNADREITIGNRTYGVPALEGWNAPQQGNGFWGMMQKDLTEEGVVFATCAVWPNGMVAVFQDAEALAQAKQAIAARSPLAMGQDAYMTAIRQQIGATQRPPVTSRPSQSAAREHVEELDLDGDPF